MRMLGFSLTELQNNRGSVQKAAYFMKKKNTVSNSRKSWQLYKRFKTGSIEWLSSEIYQLLCVRQRFPPPCETNQRAPGMQAITGTKNCNYQRRGIRAKLAPGAFEKQWKHNLNTSLARWKLPWVATKSFPKFSLPCWLTRITWSAFRASRFVTSVIDRWSPSMSRC